MALFAPSITQSAVLQAVGNFLLSILPQFTAANIVVGQENLVAEPGGVDFVVMTPMFRERLATNVDTYQDCAFTASIAAQVMTVTEIQLGSIVIGNVLFGTNVTPGTTITGQTSGPAGGVGEYTVSASQTVASGTLASGTKAVEQSTKMTIQLDVHGPNSGDNAQVISTLWRDETGTDFFQAQGFTIAPLYADDPMQMPFSNAEDQVEDRWVVQGVLQISPIITLPQQFMDEVKVTLIEVD